MANVVFGGRSLVGRYTVAINRVAPISPRRNDLNCCCAVLFVLSLLAGLIPSITLLQIDRLQSSLPSFCHTSSILSLIAEEERRMGIIIASIVTLLLEGPSMRV